MRIFLVVLAVLISGCSAMGFVAEKPRVEIYAQPYVDDVYGSDVWEVHKTPNAYMPTRYTYKGCSISLYADGTGAELSIYGELRKGEYAVQYITLEITPEGRDKVIRTYPADRVKNYRYAQLFSTNEPDMFAVVCGNMIKKLPPDVRNPLLKMYYGVGYKP